MRFPFRTNRRPNLAGRVCDELLFLMGMAAYGTFLFYMVIFYPAQRAMERQDSRVLDSSVGLVVGINSHPSPTMTVSFDLHSVSDTQPLVVKLPLSFPVAVGDSIQFRRLR